MQSEEVVDLLHNLNWALKGPHSTGVRSIDTSVYFYKGSDKPKARVMLSSKNQRKDFLKKKKKNHDLVSPVFNILFFFWSKFARSH